MIWLGEPGGKILGLYTTFEQFQSLIEIHVLAKP